MSISSPQLLKRPLPAKEGLPWLTSLTLILMEKNEEIRIRRGNRRNFLSLSLGVFFLSFFERRKRAGSGSVQITDGRRKVRLLGLLLEYMFL